MASLDQLWHQVGLDGLCPTICTLVELVLAELMLLALLYGLKRDKRACPACDDWGRLISGEACPEC